MKILNFISLHGLFAILFCNNISAGNQTALAKSNEWISAGNEKGFIENKGQLKDMNGKPVPFVLFNVEASGLNFYITDKGITLQTYRIKEIDNDKKKINSTEIKSNNFVSDQKCNIEWERIDIELIGSEIKKENSIKEQQLQGHTNYFYPHCPDGIYAVNEYEKITIRDVYPKIDWVLYKKKNGELKYDFVVHPGADRSRINLLYKSKTPIKINEQGQLELFTKHGGLKEHTPVSFYEGKNIKTQFRQNYQKQIFINNDNGYETSISFQLHSPIKNLQSDLIIDPQITWATFYGAHTPRCADVDQTTGDVLITGYSRAYNFPVMNAGTFFQGTAAGDNDVYVMKFTNAGVLLWSTFYGGSVDDFSVGIAVDSKGNVFVTGAVQSTNFPVYNSGTFFQGALGGPGTSGFIPTDAFILKFDNSGNRLWATYCGGKEGDQSFSIDIDANDDLFLTGWTESPDFAILNAGGFFQGTMNAADDAFIMKFNNSGTLQWSTYYGGGSQDYGNAIKTDKYGNTFVVGYTNNNSSGFPFKNAGTFFQGTLASASDMFIAKFDNSFNLVWSTYYGGNDYDDATSIAIDNIGNLFIAGTTRSSNFPIQNSGTYFDGTLNGTTDIFLLKFDNTGNRLWGTYLGGNGDEHLSFDNMAIDQCNNVYLSMNVALSTNIPVKASCDGGYQDNAFTGGPYYNSDFALALFDNSGTQLWTTYYGGFGDEDYSCMATDNENNLFFTGITNLLVTGSAAAYPLTDPGGGAYFDDGTSYVGGVSGTYITKFSPVPFTANITSVDPACSNPCSGSAEVTATGACSSYTYLWSNASTTQTVNNLCAGAYKVTVNNQLCADTIVSLNITSVSSFTVSPMYIQPACGTSNGSITASVNPPGGYTFLWNTTATGQTISGLSAGSYSLTVTDGSCSSVSVFTLNSNGPNITLTNQTGTCVGKNDGTADVTASGGTVPYTYVWSNGVTSITSSLNNSITSLLSNTYTVTINDNNNCSSTTTVSINQFPSPTANAGIDQTITNGTNAQLNANGGINYLWTPATDLNNAAIPDPIATPIITTTYTVVVTDANSCTATDVVLITVIEPITPVNCNDEQYLPTAFSPNDDGENDVLYIRGNCIQTAQLQIFDRWGEKVFETSSPDDEWDGTLHGQPAQSGVYVYVIQVTTNKGEKGEKKGNITLVR